MRKEFQQVDEKLAKIRVQLENRRIKKVELPAFKTRLIHLFYRLVRLKESFDVDGLEASALKLLNDHFSFLSTDSDVRKQTVDRIRKDLSDLSNRDKHQDNVERSEWEEETESSSDEASLELNKIRKRGMKNPSKEKETSTLMKNKCELKKERNRRICLKH